MCGTFGTRLSTQFVNDSVRMSYSQMDWCHLAHNLKFGFYMTCVCVCVCLVHTCVSDRHRLVATSNRFGRERYLFIRNWFSNSNNCWLVNAVLGRRDFPIRFAWLPCPIIIIGIYWPKKKRYKYRILELKNVFSYNCRLSSIVCAIESELELNLLFADSLSPRFPH